MVAAIDFDFVGRMDLTDKNGLVLGFARNSTAACREAPSSYVYQRVSANVPRFPGARLLQNVCPNSDLLTHVDWTELNVATPAKDAEDQDGNANAAWTITDDGTDANHGVHVTIDTLDFETGRIVQNSIKVKAGTGRYIVLACAVPITSTTTWIFDTQTGEFTHSSTPEITGGGGSGLAEFYADNGDGWFTLSASFTHAVGSNDKLFVGISSGPDFADASYAGSGDTIIVDEIQTCFVGGTTEYATREYAGANGDGRTEKWLPTSYKMNYWPNSEFKSDDSINLADNVPVPMDLYNYLSTFPAGQTGKASYERSTLFPAGGPIRAMPEREGPNRIRFKGSGETCYFVYDAAYYGLMYRWYAHNFSIYLEDLVVDPGTPVVYVTWDYWQGSDPSTYFPNGTGLYYIKDFKLDPLTGRRRLVVPFNLQEGWPAVRYGLGADGTNSTGEFALSAPMISEGYAAPKFFHSSSNYWWVNHPDNNRNQAPCRGLLIEPARTTLNTYSNTFNQTDWTKTNCNPADNASWTPPNGEVPSARLRDDNGGGTGEVSVSQAITVANSTTHSIVLTVFGFLQPWLNIDFENHGSLDLGLWVHQNPTLNRVPLLGTQGSDIDNVAVRRDAAWEWGRIEVTFDSDAVDTTGDLLLRLADANNDTVVSRDNFSFLDICDVNIYEGEPLRYGMIRAEGSAATQEADVASTNDLSALTGSEHSGVVEFDAPLNVATDKTVLSLHDDTANERVAIEISGGNLIFRGVDGGAEQWAISGSITAGSRCRVAFAWAANDIECWLNGVQLGTDSSATLPTVTDMNVGSDHADLEQLNSTIRRVRLFNERKISRELAIMSQTSKEAGGRTRLRRAVGKAVGGAARPAVMAA